MSRDFGFTPSTLEVDFDKNLTDLYRAITDQDWDRAVDVCKRDPEQAKTWVVRHYDDEDDEVEEGSIMWRFLPLHSACARQPPISVVAALLRAYPDGARCQDDQGMYPLHYACGNQATRDVARVLLVSYPDAAKKKDPRGMLPIHYLACWGPSSVSVVDMLLVANPNVSNARDEEGNTPLDLARAGEYPEKDSVIAVLQKWFTTIESSSADESQSRSRRSPSRQRNSKEPKSNETVTDNTSVTGILTRSTTRSRSTLKSAFTKKTSEPPAFVKKSRTYGRSVDPDGEEKKEEREDVVEFLHSRLPARPSISQEEVKSLHDEIATLRDEKQAMEDKLKEAVFKCDLQEGEIIELQDAIAEARTTSSRKQEGADELTRELDRTKTKLKGCNAELKGLRLTMVDMMEEHGELMQRSNSMNDRLKSLSVSLDAVMAQQKDLAKIIKLRSDLRKKAHQKRKENMRCLLEMEETDEDEDEALEIKLKKQTKEMEALSAMIRAAQD